MYAACELPYAVQFPGWWKIGSDSPKTAPANTKKSNSYMQASLFCPITVCPGSHCLQTSCLLLHIPPSIVLPIPSLRDTRKLWLIIPSPCILACSPVHCYTIHSIRSYVYLDLYGVALPYNQFLHTCMVPSQMDIWIGDLQARSGALRPCTHY